MPGSEITGHIVSGNSQAPGKVESQPKAQKIVKFCGWIVEYFTKDKGERSNTSSSILGASSSPEIKEPRQWLKRKQNQDAGDGAVEIIDAETSRKNDSPVKALEQRQATTLNAKDNPLERTNALISDDNQIKEKGNGKQNQDAGDGEVKTGLSRDSVVTSENDASVTTLAQRRTKELNASATRPKRKNAEIFDKNKITKPAQNLIELSDQLEKQYEEHKDLASCKNFEDFLKSYAVNDVRKKLGRREELINRALHLGVKRNVPLEKNTHKPDWKVSGRDLRRYMKYQKLVYLPEGRDEVLSDKNPLNAFSAWIGDHKITLLKTLTNRMRQDFVDDIKNAIKKSTGEVNELIDELKKVEERKEKFQKYVKEAISENLSDARRQDGLPGDNKTAVLVSGLIGSIDEEIGEIEENIKELISVKNIKNTIEYIKEHKILDSESIESLQKKSNMLDALIKNPRERRDNI